MTVTVRAGGHHHPPAHTDGQSGYRGVGSYDSYGNPLGPGDAVAVSYGPHFRWKLGGLLPRLRRKHRPADFPKN